MLKKSSRPAVSSKQGLMADPFSLPSPTGNCSKPPSSPLFPLSPRLFVGFVPKGFSDIDAAKSPTSILETKPFTPTSNPFFSDKKPRKPLVESTQEAKLHHQPVGLGIVDALKKPSKPDARMVLFGSQLKIQIPAKSPNGLVEPLQSPIEFGVKNKEAQLAMFSPMQRANSTEPNNLASGCISASEMEMSEDYTCVIAHGPNPRTVHIYDNCVVESCGNGFAAVTPRKESRVSEGFLTCCCACKKRLDQGKDIFMYRGEKAFCSLECRHQEMQFDEGMEDCLLAQGPATF
ncbi:uncharacterized protein A4U43_C03F5140 [Asparagus officinalis]|uniref:FLZ-type domain-containing protein n=1 Tax=Asparagus officinalis TaxID=4686 RepID=A0A5P1FCJ6_ASPOF|nr:protein MARD1 [Asparagus officinalis]ONK74331.1 uncharacterized protein A4U43_C03F5140 [Asparagus officinalis]